LTQNLSHLEGNIYMHMEFFTLRSMPSE